MQVKNVANPIGHDGSARPSSNVAVQIVRVARLHRLIITREIADKDAGIGARHFFHRRSRVLETFEHNFEKLSLLRIHVCCLEIINTEEIVVELTHILAQEVAARNIHRAAATAIWVIEASKVVALRWYRALR